MAREGGDRSGGGSSATASRRPTAQRALSLVEAAESIGVSTTFLRREIERGRLTPTRLTRRVLILVEDWEAYLQARRAESAKGH